MPPLKRDLIVPCVLRMRGQRLESGDWQKIQSALTKGEKTKIESYRTCPELDARKTNTRAKQMSEKAIAAVM